MAEAADRLEAAERALSESGESTPTPPKLAAVGSGSGRELSTNGQSARGDAMRRKSVKDMIGILNAAGGSSGSVDVGGGGGLGLAPSVKRADSDDHRSSIVRLSSSSSIGIFQATDAAREAPRQEIQEKKEEEEEEEVKEEEVKEVTKKEVKEERPSRLNESVKPTIAASRELILPATKAPTASAEAKAPAPSPVAKAPLLRRACCLLPRRPLRRLRPRRLHLRLLPRRPLRRLRPWRLHLRLLPRRPLRRLLPWRLHLRLLPRRPLRPLLPWRPPLKPGRRAPPKAP